MISDCGVDGQVINCTWLMGDMIKKACEPQTKLLRSLLVVDMQLPARSKRRGQGTDDCHLSSGWPES